MSTGITVSAAPAPAKKLLFLPFYNAAGDQNYGWLETSIGHNIHEAARRKYTYIKLDDHVFNKYLTKNGFTTADLYKFDKISKMAKDLGVDGVIYGTFKPNATNTRLEVAGKILSVIDRKIIAEKTVTMPVSAEMFMAVEEVSNALGENIGNLFFPSDKGALTRAAILPGWGHMHKQRPGWGYFYGTAFWSSVAFTAFTTIQYVSNRIGYANFSPDHVTDESGSPKFKDPTAAQAGFDRYISNINTYRALTLGGLVTMGVIYAVNVLHAWGIAPDVGGSANLTLGAGARNDINMAGTRTEVALLWTF